MNIKNVEEVLKWLEEAFGNFSFYTFKIGKEITKIDVEIYDDAIGDWEKRTMYFNKQGILIPKYEEIKNQINFLQKEIEKLQGELKIIQKGEEVEK